MFRRNPDVAWRVYDEEAFMISSGNIVHRLNETATHVWTFLGESKSVDDVAEMMASVYDVDGETAKKDTLELLEELKNKELVIEEK